jgi:hypothetical protein
MTVPAVDQAALTRAKWDQENYKRSGLMRKSMGLLRSAPDLSHSAKNGPPTMTDPKKTIPASVPVPINTEVAAGGTGATGTTDVTATQTTSTALDTKPDARDAGSKVTPPPAAQTPLPTNRDKDIAQMREKQQKKQAKLDKKKKKVQPAENPSGAAPAVAPPATGTPAAAAPQGAAPATLPPASNPQE